MPKPPNTGRKPTIYDEFDTSQPITLIKDLPTDLKTFYDHRIVGLIVGVTRPSMPHRPYILHVTDFTKNSEMADTAMYYNNSYTQSHSRNTGGHGSGSLLDTISDKITDIMIFNSEFNHLNNIIVESIEVDEDHEFNEVKGGLFKANVFESFERVMKYGLVVTMQIKGNFYNGLFELKADYSFGRSFKLINKKLMGVNNFMNFCYDKFDRNIGVRVFKLFKKFIELVMKFDGEFFSQNRVNYCNLLHDELIKEYELFDLKKGRPASGIVSVKEEVRKRKLTNALPAQSFESTENDFFDEDVDDAKSSDADEYYQPKKKKTMMTMTTQVPNMNTISEINESNNSRCTYYINIKYIKILNKLSSFKIKTTENGIAGIDKIRFLVQDVTDGEYMELVVFSRDTTRFIKLHSRRMGSHGPDWKDVLKQIVRIGMTSQVLVRREEVSLNEESDDTELEKNVAGQWRWMYGVFDE